MSNLPTDPVAAAVAALQLFYPPDRATAATLLDMWQHRDELTEADRTAVLGHFPTPVLDDVEAAYENYRRAVMRRRLAGNR